MGLFASKCVRCGSKRTRQKFEGLPTCESCELVIHMNREEPRVCPVDGSALLKLVLHNVIIDRCPTCDGVWLDAGELKLLQAAVQSNSDHGTDFTSGFITGMVIG